jgi:hypothetical protein
MDKHIARPSSVIDCRSPWRQAAERGSRFEDFADATSTSFVGSAHSSPSCSAGRGTAD